MATELTAKRLGLLNELLPGAARFAVLISGGTSSSNAELISETRTAASRIGKQIEILTANSNLEIDAVFASVAQGRVDALAINASNLFSNRRFHLITLAAHHKIPVIYYDRSYPEFGGLMSYGASIAGPGAPSRY
jgi:putative ABC transport system substrate-binding protein